ncbi:MAG: hypothetical protein HY079_12600 [Elusimicrobia bacterium]|nr:hypothetical protein [Elusimicrobiota bacterium]
MKRERAATRADLERMEGSLLAAFRAEMDAKLAAMGSGVDAKLDAARAGMDAKLDAIHARFGAMDKMQMDIRRLMADSVDKGARMDAMEARLQANMADLSRAVTAKLAAHEARIASLEARRAP